MNIESKLTPRLKMTADEVRPGAKVADIGTDHAYLPAYLLSKGICSQAIAADIGIGPLKNAEKVVNTLPMKAHIQLRLSDGLDQIGPDEADDFIFAGMGGVLITELLNRAPWLKDSSKQLILQPMSHPERVRKYLIDNGFEIIRENVCCEGRRSYLVITAVYTGKMQSYPIDFIYTGLLKASDSPCAKAWIQKQYKRFQQRLDALKQSAPDSAERKDLEAVLALFSHEK